MKNSIKHLAAIGLMASMSSLAVAEEAMTASVSRVTVDVANTIAMGAIGACREKGIPISVTVVDRNGIIQAQLRDTTAPPVSYQSVRKKPIQR